MNIPARRRRIPIRLSLIRTTSSATEPAISHIGNANGNMTDDLRDEYHILRPIEYGFSWWFLILCVLISFSKSNNVPEVRLNNNLLGRLRAFAGCFAAGRRLDVRRRLRRDLSKRQTEDFLRLARRKRFMMTLLFAVRPWRSNESEKAPVRCHFRQMRCCVLLFMVFAIVLARMGLLDTIRGR